MDTKDIAWFAGLLEGEGYFSVGQRGDPRITLQMTDRDVVDKAHKLSGIRGAVHIHQLARKNHKESYRFVICGSFAAGWMMTIYPFMGDRRKQKIKACLARWKQHKAVPSIGAAKRTHTGRS